MHGADLYGRLVDARLVGWQDDRSWHGPGRYFNPGQEISLLALEFDFLVNLVLAAGLSLTDNLLLTGNWLKPSGCIIPIVGRVFS
jgi:hypothetical protein